MTEEEVRQIADQFLASQSSLVQSSFEVIRRFKRSDLEHPTTIGDEWVVQYRYELDDGGVTPGSVLVIIDDATGEPHFFETL